MDRSRRRFVIYAAGGIALAAAPFATGCSSNQGSSEVKTPWDDLPRVLARIVPPTFPDRHFDIANYGAVGDGETDSSAAIAAAIRACGLSGGGSVDVPPGVFITGPVHLESNVNLHVGDGATLKFSTDPNRYLPAVFTRWQGIECFNYSPCVYAFQKTNIAITGKGTLDGQASNDNWWRWKGLEKFGWAPGSPSQDAAAARLNSMGERGLPVAQRVFGEGDMLRPMMIQFYDCTNVTVDGLTVRRSPMWAIHPVLCTNVTIRSVTVESRGPNNDGCNPECCTDVLIEECTFDTGDDCIAIKSGRDNDGRRIDIPTVNVVIKACHVKHGHGAMTIGSEISGGARFIFLDGCTIDTVGWVVRFKSNARRGGTVEHVYVRNVDADTVRESALTADFQYEEGSTGSEVPVLRDVQVSNMHVRESHQVMTLFGIPGATIDDLELEQCTFDKVEEPSTVQNAGAVKLSEVMVDGAATRGVTDLIK